MQHIFHLTYRDMQNIWDYHLIHLVLTLFLHYHRGVRAFHILRAFQLNKYTPRKLMAVFQGQSAGEREEEGQVEILLILGEDYWQRLMVKQKRAD